MEKLEHIIKEEKVEKLTIQQLQDDLQTIFPYFIYSIKDILLEPTNIDFKVIYFFFK